MGVADNKSYKNQYHFTGNPYTTSEKELPSLKGPAKINSSIKENPFKSNVNIEKDEIVLEPDLSALFKAVGKKHSGGGIDALLKPNSFIFSDDKMLAITEKEHELFELKKGGKFNPNKYTPAEVVKRNVNPKHYNRLVNNLEDINSDDLAKKSSGMMLEKYIESLGNIAYLQEAKKDFPTGLPSFSVNTAPVYNSDLKNKVLEQKQYVKYGGKVNPYAPGGLVDPCPCGKDSKGNCLPCSDAEYQAILDKQARKVDVAPTGYNKLFDTKAATLYGKFGTDPKNFNVPLGVRGNRGSYAQWKNTIQSMIDQGATLENLVKQGHGTKEGLSKLFKFGVPGTPDDYVYTPKVGKIGIADFDFNIIKKGQDVTIDGPDVPEVQGEAQGVKRAEWQFTPWQKLSQLHNLSQLAGVKRYMPYRSRYNPSYIDPSLVNPEQAVGDAKGLANQQLKATSILNPVLRNAQASAAYGDLLDKIPALRAQYDNQNSQVINQTRQYNNETVNKARAGNMANDQQYYQQVIEGLQNFDNMKSFQTDKFMNNLNADVQTNQSLAYNLLTQNNPAYGFDWKSGNFTRNKKDILDSTGNAKSDYIQNLLESIDVQSLTPEMRIKYIEAITKRDALKYLNPTGGYTMKKGGKVKGNPYKK